MNSTTAASWTDIDRQTMARALLLAQRGLTSTDPNPRVGCVLLRDGATVGEGWHERAGEAHAEVAALRAAGEQARGATAYVTLEPCSHQGRTGPCSTALIEAGVTAVVFAVQDPNPRVAGTGAERLREAGIEVRTGLMAEAAETLNCGYFKRMRSGMPWLRLKLGMSLDGRTALADGSSRWITSAAAREDSQLFRARSSAVLTGIGTILADDPALDVRVAGATRQPWRVVLDSQLRTPPAARVIAKDGEVLILATQDHPARRRALEAVGAAVEILAARAGRLDLQVVLERLARLEMNEVWVEAGATLAGELLQQRLVDELVLYVAPALLGPDARGLATLPALQNLDGRLRLRYTDLRTIGPDLRITARPL
jgi:diaminohydroxyphosphoribosylaminopyrimidine deaminase / 5-amino-6-(5-phosphoribosylamino)uracil reductase